MTETAGAVEQPEPLIGVVALRSFTVSVDGYLMPITYVSPAWCDGTCIARCRADHPTPDNNCRCGIHAVKTVAQLEQAAPCMAARLIAVIALEGQTIEGEVGYRTQAARVLDIWVCSGWRGLPAAQVDLLRTNYPDVTFHTDLAGMLARHPQIPAAGPDIQARLARRALRTRLTTGLSDLWAAVRPAVDAIESSLIRAVGLYLMAVVVIVLKERAPGLLSSLAQILWLLAAIALAFAGAVRRAGLMQVHLSSTLRGKARSALRAGATLQVVAMLLAVQWNADVPASAWVNLGVLVASLAMVSVLPRHWTGEIHPAIALASRTQVAVAPLPWPVTDPRELVLADRPGRWARQGIQPVYIGSFRSARR